MGLCSWCWTRFLFTSWMLIWKLKSLLVNGDFEWKRLSVERNKFWHRISILSWNRFFLWLWMDWEKLYSVVEWVWCQHKFDNEKVKIRLTYTNLEFEVSSVLEYASVIVDLGIGIEQGLTGFVRSHKMYAWATQNWKWRIETKYRWSNGLKFEQVL